MEKDLLINLLINECPSSSHKGFKAIHRDTYKTINKKKKKKKDRDSLPRLSHDRGIKFALPALQCPGSGLQSMCHLHGVLLIRNHVTGGGAIPPQELSLFFLSLCPRLNMGPSHLPSLWLPWVPGRCLRKVLGTEGRG